MPRFLRPYFPEKRIDERGRTIWVASDRGMLAIGLSSWIIWIGWMAARIAITTGQILATGSPVGTQAEYFDFIRRFWTEAPLYIPGNLHGFHYLPIMLILFTPLTWVGLPAAAVAVGVVSVAFLSWSVYRLVGSLGLNHVPALTGAILALAVPAANLSMETLQLQMAMTAAMIAGAAAGMRGRWREMALWLVLAIVIKPLAIVLGCLCAAAIPRTRSILAGSSALLVVAPFAVSDWTYLSGEYVDYVRQLWHITSADPGVWPFQADFSTLFSHLGLELHPGIRLAIRVAAALGTLVLALRISALGNSRATAFSLLILAVCFIGLFNPRQEDVSFLVVAPVPAALAVIILDRNAADWRGWAWVVLALLIGMHWGGNISHWGLPGLMLLIWAGLLRMMFDKRRWCSWFERA